MIKTDIAGMIWVPFHFVITPIVGLAISILVTYITIKKKEPLPIVASISCSVIILWISFIGMSGSTMILEVMSFN